MVWLPGSGSVSGICTEIKGWIRIRNETNEDPRHWLKLAEQIYLSCNLVERIRSSAEGAAAVATQGHQATEVFVQPELKAVFTIQKKTSIFSFKIKNLKIKHLKILQPPRKIRNRKRKTRSTQRILNLCKLFLKGYISNYLGKRTK